MDTDLIELRQYLLHPGRREDLIDLFDGTFVEPQEAVGMAVIGQFRDPDRPDHFVWFRAFENMTTRREALAAFYGGPVWAASRDAANSTMIDSDDVHLLRAVGPADRLPAHDPARRSLERDGFVVILVVPDGESATLLSTLAEGLEDVGLRRIGLYRTTSEPNDFPALPVHSSSVTVWFGASGSQAAWEAIPQFAAAGGDRYQIHRLLPTARSALDGSAAGLPATFPG